MVPTNRPRYLLMRCLASIGPLRLQNPSAQPDSDCGMEINLYGYTLSSMGCPSPL